MAGTVAGPRSASQCANSGPDCSVEYANDSAMTPARVGPAGSIERSTSSQTAAACGHRRHRSVSSASASDTEGTVMLWEKINPPGTHYQVKENVVTTKPGATILLFAINATVRARWCEVFSC